MFSHFPFIFLSFSDNACVLLLAASWLTGSPVTLLFSTLLEERGLKGVTILWQAGFFICSCRFVYYYKFTAIFRGTSTLSVCTHPHLLINVQFELCDFSPLWSIVCLSFTFGEYLDVNYIYISSIPHLICSKNNEQSWAYGEVHKIRSPFQIFANFHFSKIQLNLTVIACYVIISATDSEYKGKPKGIKCLTLCPTAQFTGNLAVDPMTHEALWCCLIAQKNCSASI